MQKFLKILTQRLRELVIIFISLSTFACSSKGYLGPELGSSEVSNVAIHSGSLIDIKDIDIDNNDLGIFSSSIDLLEGTHKFIISYESESTGTCYPEQRTCQVRISIGKCTGEIKTLKGRKYLITLSNKSSNISISILPKGYYDFNVREDESNIGHGLCVEEFSRIILRSERS